jgi:hypothetical protein
MHNNTLSSHFGQNDKPHYNIAVIMHPINGWLDGSVSLLIKKSPYIPLCQRGIILLFTSLLLLKPYIIRMPYPPFGKGWARGDLFTFKE